jgi:permuted papain-like amidase YaeF/Yiix C92 family enzyme
MNARWCVLLPVVAVSLATGCPRTSPPADPATEHGQSGPVVTASVLQADRRTLQSASTHLERIAAEMQELATSAPWRAGGFFDAPQQDQIESLLFRYLACRHAIWHLANYHRDNDSRYPDDEAKAKSCVVAFNAGFNLLLYDAALVKAFRGDSIAVKKLNEEFYRSRIPAGTYDRLLLEVTDRDQLRALRDSLLLYTNELQDPDSALAKIVKESSVYSALVKSTESAATRTDAAVRELVETESRIMPNLDNRARHTRLAELLGTSEAKAGAVLYAARAHLFKGVSRIKNPESHLIVFSAQQKRQVYDSLQAGDIILTYTAGYMSDIFIPGIFKHAITYVGSPLDRRNAGLTADQLAWVPNLERESLLDAASRAKLPSGQDADVIEAVGEGVIFNHLDHIMDTHINRLLVLRPRVSSQERTKALANVFLFLGDGYDFKFDFADASEQVCTEVVYRALDGKGSINFALVERAGHPTLSADDIANNYLASPSKSFEFVLFAEEAPKSNTHQARIMAGEAGIQRLTELMTAKED